GVNAGIRDADTHIAVLRLLHVAPPAESLSASLFAPAFASPSLRLASPSLRVAASPSPPATAATAPAGAPRRFPLPSADDSAFRSRSRPRARGRYARRGLAAHARARARLRTSRLSALLDGRAPQHDRDRQCRDGGGHRLRGGGARARCGSAPVGSCCRTIHRW